MVDRLDETPTALHGALPRNGASPQFPSNNAVWLPAKRAELEIKPVAFTRTHSLR
jgi:hypothetical protein